MAAVRRSSDADEVASLGLLRARGAGWSGERGAEGWADTTCSRVRQKRDRLVTSFIVAVVTCVRAAP